MCSLSDSGGERIVGLPPSLLKLANIPLSSQIEASFSDGVIVLSTVKNYKTHIPLRERLKNNNWDGKRGETELIDWGKPMGHEEW
jgi:antitoxin component of MazEF toxin-antitoxin module